ncbi:MAG: HU family DNA-binding protein [Planctomycetota bacterium]
MAKASAIKPPTKTEIYANIAESTGLSKKDVGAVFEALNDEIGKALGSKGAGTFTLPGLCKIVVQKKEAVPAREGVNPFTGETTMFKAKPARNVVKVRPLKKLKDMV